MADKFTNSQLSSLGLAADLQRLRNESDPHGTAYTLMLVAEELNEEIYALLLAAAEVEEYERQRQSS